VHLEGYVFWLPRSGVGRYIFELDSSNATELDHLSISFRPVWSIGIYKKPLFLPKKSPKPEDRSRALAGISI
jgi:hypothetical protein